MSAFRQVRGGWLFAAVVLLFLTYIGRALRWRLMMRPVAPHARLKNLVNATFIGFAAVTLFGRPGELVRPYLIAAKERVSFSSQVAVWVLERIYDLLIVLAMFGFALTRAQGHAAVSGSWLDWILRTGGYVVAGLACLCVGILVMVGIFTDAAQRRMTEGLAALPEQLRKRIEGVLLSFVAGMSSTSRGSFVLQLLGFTIAEWIVIIGCNYCVFQSFPATAVLSWSDNVVFLGFVVFGSIVQVPGIGGGFQVASVLVLTEFFNISLEAATAATLLLWVIMYLVIVPTGLTLALQQGLKLKTLRKMADNTAKADSTSAADPIEQDRLL